MLRFRSNPRNRGLCRGRSLVVVASIWSRINSELNSVMGDEGGVHRQFVNEHIQNPVSAVERCVDGYEDVVFVFRRIPLKFKAQQIVFLDQIMNLLNQVKLVVMFVCHSSPPSTGKCGNLCIVVYILKPFRDLLLDVAPVNMNVSIISDLENAATAIKVVQAFLVVLWKIVHVAADLSRQLPSQVLTDELVKALHIHLKQ